MRLLLLILLPIFSKSQTFEKTQNTFLKESYIKYHNVNLGVIMQKVTSLDDSTVFHYELGLVILRKARSSDDFMEKFGVISFDDKSFLVLKDIVHVNYFQEGKHQYSIKHILTKNELFELQTKKISYISIAGKETSFDKWEKQDLLKAFVEIERQ